MSSIYAAWRNNKRRSRLIISGVLIGGGIGAVCGALIGVFVIPILESKDNALSDPYAAGVLFGWIGLVVGILGGARRGDMLYRKRRRVEYNAARKERYANQLAAYEEDKKQLGFSTNPWDAEDRMPKVKNGKDKSSFESPWP